VLEKIKGGKIDKAIFFVLMFDLAMGIIAAYLYVFLLVR
jgi:hypothetical protein